jgi:hypothetical protein
VASSSVYCLEDRGQLLADGFVVLPAELAEFLLQCLRGPVAGSDGQEEHVCSQVAVGLAVQAYEDSPAFLALGVRAADGVAA